MYTLFWVWLLLSRNKYLMLGLKQETRSCLVKLPLIVSMILDLFVYLFFRNYVMYGMNKCAVVGRWGESFPGNLFWLEVLSDAWLNRT